MEREEALHPVHKDRQFRDLRERKHNTFRDGPGCAVDVEHNVVVLFAVDFEGVRADEAVKTAPEVFQSIYIGNQIARCSSILVQGNRPRGCYARHGLSPDTHRLSHNCRVSHQDSGTTDKLAQAAEWDCAHGVHREPALRAPQKIPLRNQQSPAIRKQIAAAYASECHSSPLGSSISSIISISPAALPPAANLTGSGRNTAAPRLSRHAEGRAQRTPKLS